MEDQQTPAPEAGDEDVAAAAHTADTEEDQTDEASESSEGDEGSGEEQISPAKARRERRKAEMDRLRTEAETARKEAEALRKRLNESGGTTDPAPKREDFQDYEEWQASLAAHKVMSQMSARERAQLEEQSREREAALDQISQKQRQAMAQQWADQEADAKTRYADYQEVARNPDLPITEAMAMAMVGSDMGPDIAYHLGKNPAEAARIAQMQPLEAARAIGLLEARLSLPKAPINTAAPDPVSPVKPKARATKSAENMSMEEWIAARKSGQIR